MEIFQRINVVWYADGWWLTVVWKERHPWNEHRRLDATKHRQPLRDDYVYEEDLSLSPCSLLRHDRDTWPLKLQTDLVVQGTAKAPGGRPVTEMQASVIVHTRTHRQIGKTILVIGDRYLDFDRMGGLRFSEPESFVSQSTDGWYAYGGVDPLYLPSGETPSIFGKPLLELFPGAYPRNPLGRGFWASPESVPCGMRLPNLETPRRRLSPSRFILDHPRQWIHAPPPAGFGWISAFTFPRCVHGAHRPFFLPEDVTEIPEVRAGLVPAELVRPKPGDVTLNMKLTHGAAPGLDVGYMFGGETITLIGFSPHGPIDLALPRFHRVCRAFDRHANKALNGLPNLQTVAIDTDQAYVDLLWSTRFRIADHDPQLSSRPCHDALCARFEVTLDGDELGRNDWANAHKDGDA